MLLKDIFEKNINRYIEGVIKADDNEHITQEIEEYVITNEIEDKIDKFFKHYVAPNTTNVGVWISGFFGSGKSHLLKILSYVLQNETINGKKAGEIFHGKISEEDFELKANVEKALKYPTRSILFNIDQKADIISKQQPDAILSVFQKVFNEMQGYYPKFGYIAEFERDLDKQELYEKFKERYSKIGGESWERGRETILLNIEVAAKALSEVKNISLEEGLKTIDNYDKQYRLSIEDFVNKVKEYIDKQPEGYRLLFCIDEMGQYIAENTKLMLNLQTLSETLSSKCKGQAWILVTAQDEIDALIGDMKAKQANDFSKIQARFVTRLNLSSANVDEVIHKRLLAKDEKSKPELEKLYQKEQNNFRTLFTFGDGTRQFHTFKNSDHFIYSYPFITYQFDLFQSCIRGLSLHNAFQGKHQSVGERSMLGVFQLVVQNIANEKVGKLVTFDQLYGGIKSTLRGEIQNSINDAEKNIENGFSVQILKLLFLVKYVKEFKATKKNIAILMVDSFDIDSIELEKKVQESLNILEDQSYIQQIAGVYEFLTNEEKDIQEEIKSTEIDSGLVRKSLGEMIFDDIIHDTKIRFEDNKQDYGFSRKLDNQLLSREEELSINVISPLYEDDISDQTLKSHSMGTFELFVKLAEDFRIKQELEMFLKTDKYVRQAQSSSIAETKRKILIEKAQQNNERKSKLVQSIEEMIINSKLFLNGSILEINGATPKNKVSNAFQELIRIAYPNLRMLDRIYKEDDLKNLILNQGDDFFKDSEETMTEAEHEVFNYINLKGQNHERVTTKSLLEYFTRRPYGWYQVGVLCVLAKLFVRNKVTIFNNSNELDKRELLRIINNNREFGNTIIDSVKAVSVEKVNKLKKFYREFFDETLDYADPKDVYQQFNKRLEREYEELKNLLGQESHYPFLKDLTEPIKKFSNLVSKDYSFIYDNVNSFSDEYLNLKEDIIDPIKRFMNGEQRKIYDSVVQFLNSQNANLNYVSVDEMEILNKVREELVPYKSSFMKDAKAALERVKTFIDEQVGKEREEGIKIIDGYISQLKANEKFSELNPEKQNQVIQPLENEKAKINQENFIPVIRDLTQNVKAFLYQKQVQQIYDLAEKKGDGAKIVQKLVNFNKIKPVFKKSTLDTEDDVEEYITELKETMLKQIKENTKIIL